MPSIVDNDPDDFLVSMSAEYDENVFFYSSVRDQLL